MFRQEGEVQMLKLCEVEERTNLSSRSLSNLSRPFRIRKNSTHLHDKILF